MENELDTERLKGVASKMIEAVTSPGFVEAMRAVRSAPEDQRLVEASRRLSPDALRAQKVPLPADMRISSRYFEKGFSPVELGDTPDGTRNLVNALNELEPGLLDRIRMRDRNLFDQLIDSSASNRPDVGIWACAGAGIGTICGCAGGGT